MKTSRVKVVFVILLIKWNTTTTFHSENSSVKHHHWDGTAVNKRSNGTLFCLLRLNNMLITVTCHKIQQALSLIFIHYFGIKMALPEISKFKHVVKCDLFDGKALI